MIRILIADDHAIVRGGLRQIIATTSDMVVANETVPAFGPHDWMSIAPNTIRTTVGINIAS